MYETFQEGANSTTFVCQTSIPMAGTVCLVRESPIVARQPRNLGYTNPGRPSQCKWSKLLDALLEVTLRVEQKAFPNRQFSNAFYEVRQANAMTRIATPPPATEILDHAPPSLPSSPLAKRPKTTANTMAPSATTGEANAPAVPKLTSSQKPPLFIKKLSNNATTPTRGSAFAAGYDLYSSHETVVPARGKTLVDTDLAIAVPEGTCMEEWDLLAKMPTLT